jgi:hypothetical protein
MTTQNNHHGWGLGDGLVAQLTLMTASLVATAIIASFYVF